MKNAIIFCNRKRDVATLHRSLLRHGFSVQALHGDMDQSARTAALEQFRKGEVTLLVASDVAARGLDIPDVSHIYNFDVPIHADDYVHRIGRTGRAGRTGVAITHRRRLERRQGGRGDREADRAAHSIHGQCSPSRSAAPQQQRARRRAPHRERPNRRASIASPRRRRRRSRASTKHDRAAHRRRARPRQDDGDDSHLPAFLLRPVTVKA